MIAIHQHFSDKRSWHIWGHRRSQIWGRLWQTRIRRLPAQKQQQTFSSNKSSSKRVQGRRDYHPAAYFGHAIIANWGDADFLPLIQRTTLLLHPYFSRQCINLHTETPMLKPPERSAKVPSTQGNVNHESKRVGTDVGLGKCMIWNGARNGVTKCFEHPSNSDNAV